MFLLVVLIYLAYAAALCCFVCAAMAVYLECEKRRQARSSFEVEALEELWVRS